MSDGLTQPVKALEQEALAQSGALYRLCAALIHVDEVK